MAVTWHDSIISKIEPVTDTTWRFWLTVPDFHVFNFKAGQFVTLDLPIGDTPKQRWRSYSIASSPGTNNTFELVIVNKEGGIGTDYLFEKVAVGDSLKFRGPAGKFTLPDEIENALILICTGTGIAPFRSMLLDIIENKKHHRDIHIVFGSRFMRDALYHDEFRTIEKQESWFHYHLALSRETNDFDGLKGYIHPLYERLVPSNKGASYYLCGWKIIMDEVKERLVEAGVAPSDIHFENYG